MRLALRSVAAADDLVDEAPPCGEIVEVARGAQHEGVGERSLEMAVGTLDRAVLVADAGIVAGRRHAVMGAERLVARRQILLGVGVEIAEGRREAVAAMLLGNAAQRPQGVLQPFRQRDETFAAEHDMGVFEAGERQTEVIEPAVEDWPAMVTPRSATSVKSDKPIRPGGCSWRKITSRSGPFTARQARMRRSSVRRVPAPSSGCRRHSSSKTAIGLSPGAAFSIGTTSLSQTSAKGSARRRSRRAFFWLGSRGSFSNR